MIFMLHNLYFEVEIQIWRSMFTNLSRHPSFSGGCDSPWQHVSFSAAVSTGKPAEWVTGRCLHRGFQTDKTGVLTGCAHKPFGLVLFRLLATFLDVTRMCNSWIEDMLQNYLKKNTVYSYHVFSVLEVSVICSTFILLFI